MKKSLILAVFAAVGMISMSSTAFARDIAVGAEVASVNFNEWGGRFVFHIPSVPLYFGVGGVVESNGSAFDFTLDYWFVHGHLSGMLDYYVGLGGYLSLGTGDMSSLALGPRLPLGMQIWPAGKVLEIFLEVAPAWVPINSNGTNLLTFELQPAVGFRIWF
jgi:hypothetical protein